MWHTSTTGIFRKQRAKKCLVVGKHVSDWGEIEHEQLSFLFKLVGSARLSKTTCIQRCQNSLAHKPSMAQIRRKVWKSGWTISNTRSFDAVGFPLITVKIWGAIALCVTLPTALAAANLQQPSSQNCFLQKNFELLALALSLQHNGDIFDKTVWFLKTLFNSILWLEFRQENFGTARFHKVFFLTARIQMISKQ